MTGSISSASSGIAAGTQWLAMVAGNVANMNDAATPGTGTYRTQSPVLVPAAGPAQTGAGVAVASTALGPAAGAQAYAPGNPAANGQGLVTYPTDSLVSQLTSATAAQWMVQSNVAVLRHAVAAYQSLLGPSTNG
ncbi:MAG: hypothetical protein M0Z63_05920 [Actinomycetota bacterium]|jgi:flagellar basal-body rod protein FlgC|nr:hypothetical protein [Actinomycetota bacterium]